MAKICWRQAGHKLSWPRSPGQPGGMGTYQQSARSIAVVQLLVSGRVFALIGSRARARFAFFSRPRCPRYAPARRPPAGRAARRGHAGRPPEHIRAPLPGMPPGPPTRTPTPAPLELVCAKLAPLASGQTRASFHHSCAAILAHSRPVSDRHPQPPPFSASQSTSPHPPCDHKFFF